MMAILYFAYGSNLHPQRLTNRVSTAVFRGGGFVEGRRLAFHKKGRDGSAKCDAAGADPSDRVFGALFVVDSVQWPTLCGIEGVGFGYDEVTVSVETNGGRVSALAFIAQREYVDPTLAPFDWYHALVIEGARFHGFPDDYTKRIDAVNTVRDSDSSRAADNWRLVEEIRARA